MQQEEYLQEVLWGQECAERMRPGDDDATQLLSSDGKSGSIPRIGSFKLFV